MSLKAKSTKVVSREPVVEDGPAPDQVAHEDEIVMCLLPVAVWEEFRALGMELKVGPAAVLTYSLNLLKKHIDENGKADL